MFALAVRCAMDTFLAAESPAPVPMSVRIKRQRDEPSLPGLVLGSGPTKRPTLASLSLGGASSAAPPPQAVSKASIARRYRLVATVFADGRLAASQAREPSGEADGSAALKRQAHQTAQARQQTAARYERVRSSRLGSGAIAPATDVLELQRVKETPHRAAATPEKPKLVPFGPPLPSSAARKAAAEASAVAGAGAVSAASRVSGRWGGGDWTGPSGEGAEADMWRDAAAAEEEEPPLPLAGAAEADDAVFDVYELMDEAEAVDADEGGPAEFERIWWEEAEDELVGDADGASRDSDSDGAELDYPEDEDTEHESGISGFEGEGEGDEWGGGRARASYNPTFYL